MTGSWKDQPRRRRQGRGDRRRWNHARADVQLMRDTRLTALAKATYIGLAYHANADDQSTHVSQSTLGAYLAVDRKTISRPVGALCVCGYLSVSKAIGSSSIIRLLPPPAAPPGSLVDLVEVADIDEDARPDGAPEWLSCRAVVIDGRNWDHIRIHETLLFDSRLDAVAIAVYAVGTLYAGIEVTYPELAALTGPGATHPEALQARLVALAAAGYIDVARTPRGQIVTVLDPPQLPHSLDVRFRSNAQVPDAGLPGATAPLEGPSRAIQGPGARDPGPPEAPGDIGETPRSESPPRKPGGAPISVKRPGEFGQTPSDIGETPTNKIPTPPEGVGGGVVDQTRRNNGGAVLKRNGIPVDLGIARDPEARAIGACDLPTGFDAVATAICEQILATPNQRDAAGRVSTRVIGWCQHDQQRPDLIPAATERALSILNQLTTQEAP